MKILVTGGAGFIGSHVVDTYIEHGHEVVVLDDLSTGRERNLNPAATFHQLDIRSTEIEWVFERERPDIVNHHAAQMDVRRSVSEPLFDADVNIVGSLNLMECARRHGVRRFIYISSGGAVYGEPQYLPCDEEHPLNPICPYGASKHTVEHYLYMYRENYGLKYTVLRYPNVYGPRQDPAGEAGVIAIFTGQMLSDQQVVIHGDGEQQRDFVYVSDCAEANLLAVTESNGSGIYNLGSGRGTSVNEIYAALRSATGYWKQAVYGPPKLGETRCIYLDASKAQRDLKWRPVVSLQEGIKRTVEYFQADVGQAPVRIAQDEWKDLHPRLERLRAPRAERMTELVTSDPVGESQLTVGEAHEVGSIEALNALSNELADGEGLRALRDRVLKLALEAVGATSGSLVLLDGHGKMDEGALEYAGVVEDRKQAIQSLQETLSRGLAGWVAKNNRAALVASTRDDPRWLKRPWEQANGGSRSAISVPLLASGKLEGVITAVHEKAGKFASEDLARMVTIAGLVALNGTRSTR